MRTLFAIFVILVVLSLAPLLVWMSHHSLDRQTKELEPVRVDADNRRNDSQMKHKAHALEDRINGMGDRMGYILWTTGVAACRS